MDEKIFNEIVAISNEIAENKRVDKLRLQSKEIINGIIKNKLISIVYGLRGVGKTTLLVTLKDKLKNSLFVSCDILQKYGIDLLEFLRYASSKGYSSFLLDEIHYLSNWERDIKIFYDSTYSKMIVSGSSAIELSREREISRRAKYFKLPPLSFREYIYLIKGVEEVKISINELVEKKKELTNKLMKYYSLFETFIKYHGLPVALKGDSEVYFNIMYRTLIRDLMYLREIDFSYVNCGIKLMKFLSSMEPGNISYNSLARSIGKSVKFVMQLVEALSKANLIIKVPPCGRGNKAIRGEDKILLPLSFRSSLATHFNLQYSVGSLREDFFVQHVSNCCYVKSGKERRSPDYKVNNYIFEIGGRSKGKSQIRNYKNSFLVKDTITLREEEIPLFLFGFLY